MIIGYETEYNKILNKVFEKERELYKKVIDSKEPLEIFENKKKLKDFTSKVMEALTEVIEKWKQFLQLALKENLEQRQA